MDWKQDLISFKDFCKCGNWTADQEAENSGLLKKKFAELHWKNVRNSKNQENHEIARGHCLTFPYIKIKLILNFGCDSQL